MSSTLDASTGLTCISCRVVFADGDIQREHYRSEWHRYNLKRKVAELPPVTCEQFEQKAVSFKDKTTEKVAVVTKASFCAVCNKNFQSSNAYDNHLNSKKHKENDAKPRREPVHKLAEPKLKLKETVKAEDIPMKEERETGDNAMDEDDNDSEGWVTADESEEEDFDESNGIPVTTCLFCSNPSGSMTENVEHMGRLHGFFLPDAEYCIDVEAMLRYLGLKVGSGNLCLWCSESRKFRTLDACQKHMRDKAHCRVAHEGNAMLEFDDFYDYSSMYPEGEEDDSSNVLVQDGYSLILPSGARVGHRSLMRYYRQNLKPENALVKSTKSKEALNNLISQYRAIGWTGTTGPLAIQRAKDMKFMRRLKSQQWLKIGMGSNKLFKTKGRKDQLN